MSVCGYSVMVNHLDALNRLDACKPAIYSKPSVTFLLGLAIITLHFSNGPIKKEIGMSFSVAFWNVENFWGDQARSRRVEDQ